MRKVEYLSPSQLFQWRENKEAYYVKYLADVKPPPMVQTKAMAVGSGFDAYVKCAIDPLLNFREVFDQQVDAVNRVEAMKAGSRCFDEYKRCGALGMLQGMLSRSRTKPVVDYGSGLTKEIEGVVLLGKPDLVFDTNVVLDWKVNGYYSTGYPVSGYTRKLPGGGGHNQCEPLFEDRLGDYIDGSGRLERLKPDWALQLCVYGWLLGVPVGAELLGCIDQLCWVDGGMVVCQHRCVISGGFQCAMMSELQALWNVVQNPDSLAKHISPERQRCLDSQAEAFSDPFVREMLHR
jgi:hypothetical protein